MKQDNPFAKLGALEQKLYQQTSSDPVEQKPAHVPASPDPASKQDKPSATSTKTKIDTKHKGEPVPVGVPPPVRGTVPRTPKIRRIIRQRQPFDIFEDQYARLKEIANAEREFVDGRGMSQMVREAIDLYLKEHYPSTK